MQSKGGAPENGSLVQSYEVGNTIISSGVYSRPT